MALARTATRAATGSSRVPFLALALVLANLTPVYFYAGPVLLEPMRLMLIVLIPSLLIGLVSGRYGGFRTNDMIVLAYAAWYALAILLSHGSEQIIYAGLQTIFVIGGYMVGRASIRNIAQLKALVELLRLTALLLLPLAILETQNGLALIPRAIAALPGFSSVFDVNYAPRLGLQRAQTVLAHPIHLGLYATYVFALYLAMSRSYASVPTRAATLAALFALTVCSVSSGPLSALLLTMGLGAYWVVTQRIGFPARPWKTLSLTALVLYVPLEYLSNRPLLFVIAEFAALNPATAGWRMHIFNFGSEQVMRTPLFGIGLNTYPRPSWLTASVDNHWLLIALQAGLPALILFAILIYRHYRQIARNYRKNGDAYDDALLACGFFLFVVIVALATVAVWLNMLGFLMFIIGAFGFIFEGRPTDPAAGKPAASGARPGAESGRRRTVL